MISTSQFPPTADRSERGAVLVLSLFVLALLSALGISLLFLSLSGVRSSRADVRSKAAFYFAEAGLEDARGSLWDSNRNGSFTNDLGTAAGANGVLDFDPASVQPVYDGAGTLTGYTGYGDDVPLKALTAWGGGHYIAFLTNDPTEGGTTDVDGRVVLSALGAGAEQSGEIVQATIEMRSILIGPPPATITLLGPTPEFASGSSVAKQYIGTDCAGAGSGVEMPVVGVIDAAAEAAAELGVNKPGSFESGTETGLATVADLTDAGEPTVVSGGLGTLDTAWAECGKIVDLIDAVSWVADYSCTGNSCAPPNPTTPEHVSWIDGDLMLDNTTDGYGTLVVTGELRMHGGADWHGLILVLGEGRFVRYGAGNGTISGALILADVAGPDGDFGTADDCTTGLGQVYYDESGGGTGDTIYCSLDVGAANPVAPYAIVGFLQR